MEAPFKLSVDKQALKAFKQDLRLLGLSKQEKKQILHWTFQALKKKTQSNINKQQSPTGKSWKPRKKGEPKLDGLTVKQKRAAKKEAKMLKNMAKYFTVLQNTGIHAVLGYRLERTGQIYNIHNYGFPDTLPPSKKQIEAEKKWVEIQKREFIPSGAATEHQAARLKALGYNAPQEPYESDGESRPQSAYNAIQRKWRQRIKSGANRRSVSIGEIRQTLTQGQAGLLIRMLDPDYSNKAYRKRWNERNKPRDTEQREGIPTDNKQTAQIMDGAVQRTINKQK